MIEKLISFKDIPLGSRFKYPSHDAIYVVLDKYRNKFDEPMRGKIAEYIPLTEAEPTPFNRQSLYSHFGDSEDCPDMVLWVG